VNLEVGSTDGFDHKKNLKESVIRETNPKHRES